MISRKIEGLIAAARVQTSHLTDELAEIPAMLSRIYPDRTPEFYDVLGGLIIYTLGLESLKRANEQPFDDLVRGTNRNLPDEWELPARRLRETPEENRGETLGFGALIGKDGRITEDRDAILAACADHYRIRPQYARWLNRLTIAVMGLRAESNRELALWWCGVYSQIVELICVGCGHSTDPDGPATAEGGMH